MKMPTHCGYSSSTTAYDVLRVEPYDVLRVEPYDECCVRYYTCVRVWVVYISNWSNFLGRVTRRKIGDLSSISYFREELMMPLGRLIPT